MSRQRPAFHRHRVRRGDTLWKIAREAYGHGDLWYEISEANHLRPGNPILVGQELVIPTARHATTRIRDTSAHPSHPSQPSPGPQVTPGTVPHITQSGAGHVYPQQAGHPSIAAAGGTGPFQLARPVLYPAFKIPLDQVISHMETPEFEMTLTFKGELVVQMQGVITGGLTATPQGMEAEYKKEADGVLRDFFQKCTVKVDGNKAEVTLALGATIRNGNQVLGTTEVAPKPPAGLTYTYSGQEMKFTYRGFDFAGKLGYELEVQKRNNDTNNEDPAPASNWKRVAVVTLGVGVVVGGVAILVGDAFKDVGTGGVGLVETPISWAAAMRLFMLGGGMIRAAVH